MNKHADVNVDSDEKGSDESEEVLPPIQLFSADANDYTGDVLTLILSRLMNPSGNEMWVL